MIKVPAILATASGNHFTSFINEGVGAIIVLTHTLLPLSKLDLKVGKNPKIRRFQDNQTYVFIVCLSYLIMCADSQIIF